MSKSVKQHIRTHEQKALIRASLLIVLIGLPLLLWSLKVANQKAAAAVIEPQKTYLSYLLLTNNINEIQRIINSISYSEVIKDASLIDEQGNVIATSVPKISKAIVIGSASAILSGGQEKSATITWSYQISWALIFMIMAAIIFVGFCIAAFVRKELDKLIKTLSQPIDLITQVAHDIRSPLSSLNVLASDAMLTADKKEIFQKAISRINDIANELLATGKSFNNETNSNLKPVNISKLVQEIVLEKKTQFLEYTQLQIETDIDATQIAWSRVNEMDFARILSNLVNNAVEALNDKSGKITIGVRVYSDNVSIIIQDNGRGMSPETVSKLGKESFTTGSGSGLGTYHAFNKVKDWGGKIEVFSKLGEGSVFNIQLVKDLP